MYADANVYGEYQGDNKPNWTIEAYNPKYVPLYRNPTLELIPRVG